ncbi:MAG: DinB family protein [Actinopolymorphaceae bacterium]
MSTSNGAPHPTQELDALIETLHSLRTSVLGKLGGLSEEDARRSTVPSGTNVAGLIQHLTFVESKWFEQIVAGRKPSRGKRSMQVDRSVSLQALRADYRAACDISDALITELGDPAAPVTHNGKTHDLRWAILAVINETARHAGHADIIREQVDGKTGR